MTTERADRALQGNTFFGRHRLRTEPTHHPPPADHLGKFASIVLADTEDTRRALLPQVGGSYEDPRLVLFTGAVRSACGTTSSAVGPFYCPADHKVYLDLTFFDEDLTAEDLVLGGGVAFELEPSQPELLAFVDRESCRKRLARLLRDGLDREVAGGEVRVAGVRPGAGRLNPGRGGIRGYATSGRHRDPYQDRMRTAMVEEMQAAPERDPTLRERRSPAPSLARR